MFNAPSSYLKNLKENISLALKDPKTEPIAAFDADGTCWFSDVGRDFFEYQIKRSFFPNQEKWTWKDYKKQEDKDIKVGLLWMAQILKGFSLEEVRSFGRDFNQNVRPHFIQHQKEVIRFLIESKVTVYIVTASVKWTIEAAASELGIPEEQVIGVETWVENGVITDKQKGHMTWAEGKVKALLEKTGGKKPFFASGNTMSDVPLCETASHIKQIIHSVDSSHSIFESERQALSIAQNKGWHFIDFQNKLASH